MIKTIDDYIEGGEINLWASTIIIGNSSRYSTYGPYWINIYGTGINISATNYYSVNASSNITLQGASNITLSTNPSGSLTLMTGSANIASDLSSIVVGTFAIGATYYSNGYSYTATANIGITNQGAGDRNLLYILSNPNNFAGNVYPFTSNTGSYHIALKEDVWTYAQCLKGRTLKGLP